MLHVFIAIAHVSGLYSDFTAYTVPSSSEILITYNRTRNIQAWRIPFQVIWTNSSFVTRVYFRNFKNKNHLYIN